MLRNTIFAALLLAGLVACGNDPIDQYPEKEGSTIAFGSVATKAPVTEASQITEFGVWAQMNLGDQNTVEEGYDEYIHILEGERVWRDDSSSPWDYDNTRYWVDNRVFRFFGVYPYGTTVHYGDLPTQNGKSYKGYQVTFDTPAKADVDLLTAYTLREIVPNIDVDYSEVEMGFKHELVNVRFEISQDFVKSDYLKVRVKSLQLINPKKKGFLTTVPHPDYTPTWAFDGSVQSYTHNWDGKGLLLENATKASPWPWEGGTGSGLLLIPQPINASNKVGLVVNYEFCYIDSVTKEEKSDWESKEVRLESLPQGQWQAGTTVTYSLSIYEDNAIVVKTIDVSVLPWGTSGSSGTVIIK